MAKGAQPAEQPAARLVELLQLRHTADGLPGRRQPRLRSRASLPSQAAQGARTRHTKVPRRPCLRPPRCVATPPRASWPAAVGLAMNPVGKPDAGNRHVRFDERGEETERCRMAQATAPLLDSTRSSGLRSRNYSASNFPKSKPRPGAESSSDLV